MTPRLGEGPPFPSLLMKKNKRCFQFTHSLRGKCCIPGNNRDVRALICEATINHGPRKKKKAVGALGDNEKLMRKQRTELCLAVFC